MRGAAGKQTGQLSVYTYGNSMANDKKEKVLTRCMAVKNPMGKCLYVTQGKTGWEGKSTTEKRYEKVSANAGKRGMAKLPM
jgi:hypothetical protein